MFRKSQLNLDLIIPEYVALIKCSALCILLYPSFVLAEWQVVSQTDVNSQTSTQVAYTENNEGYSLEIYKDSVGAVRSRFSLNTALDMFAKKSCPTYQVDSRELNNRSINDAPCLTDLVWSEFILGYEENNTVNSKRLNALMNGSVITFRYRLENGAYKETEFSLAGSKRATLTVLGPGISITP